MYGFNERSCWNYLEPLQCPTFNLGSGYFWCVVTVVLLLVCFDAFYILRSWWARLCGRMSRQSSPPALLSCHLYTGVCLTSNMNFNNNMSCASHFLRECNLAFQHFLCTSHLDYALTALNARILNSSNNLKFRRKLGFLQNYCIRTRLTWWDKKALYLEQKLTCPDERGTLCAINFSRQTLEGAEMHELLGQLNVCTCLPEYPPPEIEAWNVFIHTINQKLTVSGAR